MTGEIVEVRSSEQEITMREPESVLADATKAAKTLTQVLRQKKNPVIVNNEQYLEYEDWQTLGQFYGYTAKTRDAVPVEVNGVKGAKAYADLVDFRTGLVIGGAEAYCMFNEENWKSKAWFQLASMAQTRAGAKAFRNRLAWIVVLAGYKPTPFEEMAGIEPEDKSQHYCKLHGTNFFKSSKMKAFAHPIGSTKEWCYERSEKLEQPPEAPISTQEMPKSEGDKIEVEEVDKESLSTPQDLNQLADAMNKAGWDADKLRLQKYVMEKKWEGIKVRKDFKKWQVDELVKDILATIGE